VRFAAVVVAAGRSSRFAGGTGGIKKEYRLIADRTVLELASTPFLAFDSCSSLVVVIPEGDELRARAAFSGYFLSRAGSRLSFVPGGAERRDSVLAALRSLSASNPDLVLVHDGARPRVSAALVGRVIEAALGYGAAVPVVPVSDTIKEIGPDGFVTAHPVRASLGAAQTPQGFRYAEYARACERSAAEGFSATDDAEVWARYGGRVRAVEGEHGNTKITFLEDLR